MITDNDFVDSGSGKPSKRKSMLAAYVLWILVGGFSGDLLYLRKYAYAAIRIIVFVMVVSWIAFPAIIQDSYISMSFIMQDNGSSASGGNSIPTLQGIRDFGRYLVYGYWGLCSLDVILIPFWVAGHNRRVADRI